MADNDLIQQAISRGYSIDEIADTLSKDAGIDPFDVRERGYSSADIISKFGYSVPEQAPKKSRSWKDAALDTGAQIAEGAVNIVKAPVDLVAPNSSLSGTLENSRKYWYEAQSPEMKAKISEADAKVKVAGKEGLWEEVKTAASEYATDPALASRFATTNIASMVPGLVVGKAAQVAALAKGATAAKAAGIATGSAGATNAVLNAGGARGDAFESIKAAHIAQGKTELEATELALSESITPAAVGGAAGYLSGKIGAEKAFLGGVPGQSVGRAAAAKTGAKTIGAELVGEQIEEVTPQLTTNVKLNGIDGRSVTEGIGATVVQTALGSGPMAGAGGVAAYRSARDIPTQQDILAQEFSSAVEGTNFTQGGNDQAAVNARQGVAPPSLGAIAPPSILDQTNIPDALAAFAANNETGSSALAQAAQSAASPSPIDQEIANLEREAGINDQSQLLADVIAVTNPTGTLTVSGENAAEAVRSLGENIPMVTQRDGSVLVSRQFAEPVSAAIQQAQEVTKPLEQQVTPMPLPAAPNVGNDTSQVDVPSVSNNPERWVYRTNKWKEKDRSKVSEVGTVGDAVIFHEKIDAPYGMGQITVVDKNGNVLGDAFYDRREDDGKLEAAVEVSPQARRKGIASAMYDSIESISGEKLSPAADGSAYAQAFWKSRESKTNQQQVKPKPTTQQSVIKQDTSGLAARDDLVGAIMRVTGNKGISAGMAQTITGDKAGAGNPKLRGLFLNGGTMDLGDVAELLRVQENFDVRDGDHLSELIRNAAAGEVAVSMGRMEDDAAANEEAARKDYYLKRAEELGIKKIGGKRKLEQVIADVEAKEAEIAIEQKRLSELEAVAERQAIQTADILEDGEVSEAEFMKLLSQTVDYTEDEINAAVIRSQERADRQVEAVAGFSADEEAQGDSGKGNGNSAAAPESSTPESRESGTAEGPVSESLSQEMAGFTGVSDVEYKLRQMSHKDKGNGDVELGNGKFITLEQAISAAKQHMDKADWSKPFQFNRVLDIAPIDWNTMVDAMKSVTVNAESAPNLELTGETNAEAAANAARKVDPNALTKEEINAQSAGFGLQQQDGAPKPGPVQDGLMFSRSNNGFDPSPQADQEFAETERAYGGREAHDAAIESGKTKLTYRQWVQVRTPKFKAWFGDWEGLRSQQRLDAMPPVKIKIPDEWRGLNESEMRKEMTKTLDALVRSKAVIENKDIGTIRVGRVGERKTTSTSKDPAKMLVANDISSVLEGAFFARATKPEKGDGPDIDGYSRLLAKVDVDGLPLVAIFTVRHQSDGKWYYNTVTVENEKAQDSYGRSDQQVAGSKLAPISGLDSFIRQPLNRVNPDSVSKVIDPQTGEPMVVYHGTRGDFNVFDTFPSYFTSENVLAGMYAKRVGSPSENDAPNILPVFLRIKNIGKTEGAIVASEFMQLKANSNDGATNGNGMFVVLDPTQIKSATGNNGDFDAANPDIRKSQGAAAAGAPITEAQAATAITNDLGDAAKVLIDAGQIVLVRTEEGLRNLVGAKFMTAWHGSPHDHNKFDSSKIGTGEGNQSYGFGLYFAGAKSVAEWYRNALSKRNSGNSLNDRMTAITIDGKPVMDFGIDMDSELADMAAEGDLFGAYFHANKRADRWAEFASDESYQFKDYAKEKADAWRNLESALETAKEFRSSEKGRLYQVELAPSENEYLDWDNPLSEQSEFVRNALTKAGLVSSSGKDIDAFMSWMKKEYPSVAADWGVLTAKQQASFMQDYVDETGNPFPDISGAKGEKDAGSKIYQGVSATKGGDQKASDHLHSIGIRGIRYLDGSSRGAGEGNSNYVIFSDDDVSITAKFTKEQGAIQGATLPDGRIVLVLENLTQDNISGVLKHEGFHSSIKQLLGEKTYAQLMNRLGELAKLNKSWAAQAEKAIPADTKPGNWLEEIGAYAIEQYERGAKLPGSISKWVSDFLSAIRTAIIKSQWMPERTKLMAMKHLKPQDLSRLAVAGLRAKAGMVGQAQGSGAMAYSNNPQQVDPKEAGNVENGIEGGSVVDAAKWIAKNAPSQDYRIIATMVAAKLQAFESVGGKLGLHVAHDGDEVPSGLKYANGAAMKMQGEDHIEVWINGADLAGKVGTTYETVLHELVHAATMLSIADGRANLSATAQKAMDEFDLVKDAIKDHFMARSEAYYDGADGFSKFERHLFTRRNNALADDHEIIAWAMTSRDMQEYLEGIPYKSNNLWTSFVEAIRKIIGLSPKADTALSEVLRVGKAMIDEQPLLYNYGDAKMSRAGFSQHVIRAGDAITAGRGFDRRKNGFERSGKTEEVQARDIERGQDASSGSESMGLKLSRAQPAQPSNTLPEETKARKAQRLGQDKLNRFTVIKEFLAEQGVVLSEQADVYKAEERMHSRFANKVEDFRDKLVIPLVQKIQKAGYTMEDVSLFLHAQHAPERNAQVAKANKQMPDGGSGMLTADAQAVVAATPADLKALANEFRDITEMTKHIRLDAGLIPQDMVDAWEGAYTNYVPLKGGPDEKASKTGSGKGLATNVKMKRALGHGQRDGGEWIIENILADYERAVMESEKNRVGHHLVKMALQVGRDDLITLGKPEKRAILRDQVAYEVRYKGQVVGTFQSAEAARTFKTANAAMMKSTSPSDYTITKSNDPSVIYSASPMLQDNEVNVYINGHAVRVQINDELLARAYKNMGAEALGTILSAGRMLNGYFSKIYTGYNPEFILTNIVRDFTTGLANITGEEGAAFAGTAMVNYAKSFGTLLRYAHNGTETKWIKMYREDGGNTGAAYLSDMERLGGDIKTEYDAAKGVMANFKEGNKVGVWNAATRNLFNLTLHHIEKINQAGENAMRLAIYQAAIESGKSRGESASLAKNSTVNFNRKGELGQQANAMFLFFNAGVQGTASLAHAHVKGKHRKQAWAVSSGIIALGYIMAMAMGDDDEYDKLSDYEKSRNLMIKAGDGWAKIPVPYGYGFFWNTGRTMADAVRNGDFSKMPWHVASSFIGEFTPFGGVVAGDKPDARQLNYALPTVFSLVGAPIVNRTGMGSPIFPESSYDPSKPDNQKMWRNTKGSMADELAQALKPIAEVSPETLKHYGRTFTGGAGAFIGSSVDAAKLTYEGADLEVKEMPFVRKFYKEVSVADARGAYYTAKTEAKEAENELNRARKAGELQTVAQMRNDNRELLALDKYADALQKRINAARDRQDVIKMSDKLTVAEKRLQLKLMERDEEKLYDQFLERFKLRMDDRQKRLKPAA